MSELRLNKKRFEDLADKTQALIDHLTKTKGQLLDENEDIYTRYQAMVRLGIGWKMWEQSDHMASHAFRLGFDSNHPFFKTTASNENGWESPDLETNPFFENCEKHENQEGSHITALDINNMSDDNKLKLLKVLREIAAEQGQ